jgi:putative FmdB family regulatory protein
MPIYAYRCASCGHARDVLQKMSDPVLTVCPACGADAFSKQLTAAGFQLKGSGWYVTDFRNQGSGASAGAKTAADAAAAPAPAAAEGGSSSGSGGAAAAPAAPAASGAPGAGGCGGSCACH